MKTNTVILLIVLTFSACNIGPKPIDYGADGCHFCSMTIVDRQHAAEYVTHKGKAFKLDATECMLNQLKEVDSTSIALFLVNDYTNPGELVDATKATYLISEHIPSPMGAYLSAFSSKEEAEKVHNSNTGQLLIWAELRSKYE